MTHPHVTHELTLREQADDQEDERRAHELHQQDAAGGPSSTARVSTTADDPEPFSSLRSDVPAGEASPSHLDGLPDFLEALDTVATSTEENAHHLRAAVKDSPFMDVGARVLNLASEMARVGRHVRQLAADLDSDYGRSQC